MNLVVGSVLGRLCVSVCLGVLAAVSGRVCYVLLLSVSVMCAVGVFLCGWGRGYSRVMFGFKFTYTSRVTVYISSIFLLVVVVASSSKQDRQTNRHSLTVGVNLFGCGLSEVNEAPGNTYLVTPSH